MKVETSFDMEKDDDEKDEVAGCTCLAGALLTIIASLVGAIGCGLLFGAAWGFLAYAAFMAACGLLMFAVARKVLKGKGKGKEPPKDEAKDGGGR